MEELDDEDAKAELERARNYNDQLTDQVKLDSDPFRDGNADTSEYDSRLNVTKAGDVFYIHVYDLEFTYTVDQIKKVALTDTSELQIVDGEDYVMLVICVTVMVNGYRLLVRKTTTRHLNLVIILGLHCTLLSINSLAQVAFSSAVQTHQK